MKRFLLFGLGLGMLLVQAQAQTTWTYDFGTNAVGPFNTLPDGVPVSAGLPATQTNGGTPYYYAGPTNYGSVGLVQSQNAGGTGAELQIVNTSTTGNGNGYRYTIDQFASPSAIMSVSFNIFIPTDNPNGNALIALGNGTSYAGTNKSQADAGHSLVLFRVNLANGGLLYYSRNLANTGNGYIALPGSGSITPGVPHKVTLFANNGSGASSYTFNNQTYDVASQAFHVWIDNAFVTEAPNTASGSNSKLAADDVLSSIAFGHHNSTGTGTYFIDDVIYSNFFNVTPLPVTFTQISAKRAGANVNVSWTTASETNNDHFEIEASTDGKTFKNVKTVASKNGNSSEVQVYQETIAISDFAAVLALPLLLGFVGFSSFSRRKKAALFLLGVFALATSLVACQKEGNEFASAKEQLNNGIISGQKTVYIRIKQVDKNGDFSYSDVVVAK